MAEFTVPKHGEICWRELATTDYAVAQDFYTRLFGWHLERSKVTSMDYKQIQIEGRACGGMMEINESWGEHPPPSHWKTYIAVDDASRVVGEITSLGGSVCVPPFDAQGVGKIAIVADPAGASFAIIQFEEPSDAAA